MSPTGGGKPLFDLMPDGRRADAGGTPRPAPERRPGLSRRHDASRWAITGALEMPTAWLYAGLAIALTLCVIAYGVGYRVGAAAERNERRAEAAREAEGLSISDPLRPADGDTPDAGPGTGGGTGPGAGPGAGRSTGGSGGQGASGAGSSGPVANIITPDGLTRTDPRKTGHNYLELATLPREQAEAAVRYLRESGVESIAVPASGRSAALDRRGGGRNTSGPFRVVALDLAIPGERYSAMRAERQRFEQRIAALGKAWTERGGASDFKDPLWRRYGG